MPRDDTPEPRVRKVIANHLAQWVDGASLPLDFEWSDDLRRDMNADSLDIVELTMALEEEFGVEISDDRADHWQTASDLLDTVRELVK